MNFKRSTFSAIDQYRSTDFRAFDTLASLEDWLARAGFPLLAQGILRPKSYRSSGKFSRDIAWFLRGRPRRERRVMAGIFCLKAPNNHHDDDHP